MGLKLHPIKTRVVNLKEPKTSLDFLGYTFRFDRDLKGRGHRYLNWFPAAKAEKRIKKRIKALTHRRCSVTFSKAVQQLGKALTDWGRYSCRGYPSKVFRRVDNYVLVRLDRFLRNRSQRRSKPPEGKTLYEWAHSLGLERLGAPATIEKLRRRKRSRPQTKQGRV